MQGFCRVLRIQIIAFCTLLGLAAPGVAGAAPSQVEESHVGTELVLRALSLLGVNYRLGGTSPATGLDCSGLVRHVFSEAAGLVLPRRAEEMSRNGSVVRREQLRPGDLVFFNTLRRAFSHVGIYIGNGQFVHAPSSGGSVRVESLSGSYWTKRFNGARRVIALDDAAQIRSDRSNASAWLTPGLPSSRGAADDDARPPAVSMPPERGAPAGMFQVVPSHSPYIN